MEKRLTLRKTTRRVLALLLSCAVLAAAAGGAYLTRQQEAAEVLSKMGSRGEEVRRIQQKLTSLGYFSSAIDGIYGTRTQSAVRSFQRDRGLAVDGIAGPKTLAALGLSSSSTGGGQYSSNDLYLLAKVIAAEARGEPYTQPRVARVVSGHHPRGRLSVGGVHLRDGLELEGRADRRGEKGGARRHQRLGPDGRRDILL